MMHPEIEIQLIAVVVAVACSLAGVFLVLRRMALMSDAISHAILLGIVLAFFVTGDLTSPFLIAAAAVTGLVTVLLVETLHRTRLVREDAAIGLVFHALFSIGVILISRYATNVHLDTDAVLLGELVFAPFDRFVLGGVDIGPRALYVMLGILILNALFIVVFFKELKLTTFDPGLAAALGFSPVLVHYLFMGLVSVTAVGAFDAVGSVLVVAMMIGPPAAAYLLTDHLSRLILISSVLASIAALSGYGVSYLLDASIAGCMAVMVGVIFFAVLLVAPERGVIATAQRRRRQRWEFAEMMLAIHLWNHELSDEEAEESRIDHLHEHLRWDAGFAAQVVERATRDGLVHPMGDRQLELTELGRGRAREALAI